MMFDKGRDFRKMYPDVHEDHALLIGVLNMIKVDGLKGWGLEFGVATGTTLGIIARDMPVIGFDSFEGLPEDWREGFPKGFFNGVRPPAEIPNTTLVEGWFEDTVPNYDWPDDIALVHIDCDLYSSTWTVLKALDGHLKPGTYIVFDEFFGYDGYEKHEERAWTDFVERDAWPVRYDVIGHGREQWAVRIK